MIAMWHYSNMWELSSYIWSAQVTAEQQDLFLFFAATCILESV